MRFHHSRPRRGFTIVEMLVAAGVSMVLMVIITEAFKRGIDMFRTMRAQGNMQERLRTAGTALRDDLAAHHFNTLPNNPSTVPNYLSVLTLDELTLGGWVPPPDGFFRIYQGPMGTDANGFPIAFAVEGTDRDNMLSTHATTHILHFTVKRRGTSADNMFRTGGLTARPIPNIPTPLIFPNDFVDPADYRDTGVLASQWAEVAYFLVPNGENANGTLLFNLCRRTKLLLPPLPANVVPADTPPSQEISTRIQISPPAGQFYNRTTDVTQPPFRFGMLPSPASPNVLSAGVLIDPRFMAGQPQHIVDFVWHGYPPLQENLPWGVGPASPLAGDDVILANVISFEVKVSWDPTPPMTYPGPITEPTDRAPLPSYVLPGLGAVSNSDYPFDYLPLSQRNQVFANRGIAVFDTWSQDANSQYGNPLFQYNGPFTVPSWRRFDNLQTGDQTGARIPLRIRPKAVLIRLRIWDAKAEQARQLTIIQDL